MRAFLKTTVVAAFVAMIAATAGMAGAAELPKVRLFGASSNVQPYHGFLFLGNPLGFYEELGVDVEFGSAGGSTAAIQLLGSGQADLAYVGMDALILAKANQPELPVKAVYLHDRGNIYEIVVPNDSDIKSVADLKGKVLGVANLASGALPVVRTMVAEAGLDPNADIGLIPVGYGAQAGVALRSGRVDALALFRAQHAILETQGFEFRYFKKDLPSAVLAINEEFLANNREAAVQTLKGVILGTVFAQTRPEETVREYWKLFGKSTGVSEDEGLRNGVHVLEATADLWKDVDDTSVKWGEMDVEIWNRLKENMLRQGVLKEDVPTESLFTTELIDEINEVDIERVK